MARIVEGSVSDKWDLVASLLQDHWEELAKNKRIMVLKPDVEAYRAMEESGRMITLIAYEGEEIIGYSATFLVRHMHYADLITAMNDVLFVVKEHRHGRTGLQLIRETERVAKERGAQLMIWHAKQDTALEAILPRLGYNVQEIMLSKEL
jgi:GNAT superfamily N-acetyltransferase